jgi:hypothetical protein
LLATVRDPLINNRRDPDFRMWRGLKERDSSDDEWEEDFWRPTEHRTPALDEQVDTRQMVDDAFVQEDDAYPSEEAICEEVIRTFSVADRIHEENMDKENWDQEFDLEGGARQEISRQDEGLDGDDDGNLDNVGDPNFDPSALEEAIRSLYKGAKSTKLAAMVLLVNLCTVHGVSNCFLDCL